jgi:copper/silver efflux system protein
LNSRDRLVAGVAAETGVVMLIYLDHALTELRDECAAAHRPFTRADLNAAIMRGAVERVRPKMMTVVAIMAGLLPIMWSTGTGSEVMPASLVRLSISALIATIKVLPDMANAAISGVSKTGYKMPPEIVHAGRRPIEVVRMRITDAGRRALAG